MRTIILKAIILFTILFFTISILTFGQTGKVPAFRMILYNGKLFRAEDLPFEKPIVILYFSPDCEECHKITEAIVSKIDELKNVSVAMITYMSLEKVAKFVTDYKLSGFRNFYIGTEGNSLFVLNYYNIKKFPYLALYNKDGSLIKKYSNEEIDIKDLIMHLKDL